MTKTIYVRCTVSQGLFESEFYITVKGSSVYVDRVNVQVKENPSHNGDEVEGKVLAYLVEEKSDQALIELPGEPVVGGLRAWVPKADLAYAY
jgi:urease accessory protein UreH